MLLFFLLKILASVCLPLSLVFLYYIKLLCFQFEIALTRYNGGSKGPVVMFHGAGVSSGMFSLDTIDTNLVEYLVQHRYDVTFATVSCSNPLETFRF